MKISINNNFISNDRGLNSNMNFKSINNPVKSYKFLAKGEVFQISEIPIDKLKDDNLVLKLVDFFCINFLRTTKDPYWKNYAKPEKRDPIKKGFVDFLNPILHSNDRDFTMMIVKNSSEELAGACMSFTPYNFSFKDRDVLYLD